MPGWKPRSVLIGGAAVAVLGWTCPRPGAVAGRITDPQGWIRRDGLDVVAGQLAGLVGWSALAWLTAGVTLVVGSRLPGAAGRLADRAAGRVLPTALRRALAVALGLGLAASGTGAGASGAPAPVASSPGSAAPPTRASSPWPPEETTALWTPPTHRTPLRAAPTGRSADPPPYVLGAAGATGGTAGSRPEDLVPAPRLPSDDAGAVDWPLADAVRPVTVGPGDSLWLIAARRLGHGATVADVAEEWPEWYATNRAAIGPDPDLLRVGQRLAPP